MSNRFLDQLQSSRRRPLVIAHRGDSMRAPENTLEAARLAWETGAQGWELDVQLSRDGVAVVVHDDTLTRTTDVALRFPDDPRREGGYRVVDFDWDELRALDAGSWFLSTDAPDRSALRFGSAQRIAPEQHAHYESGQVRLPTLRGALGLTHELDWLVNVELKSFPEDPPGLLETVLDDIARTETSDRVLLSCFDHRQIARLSEVVSERHPGFASMPSGILTWTPLYRPYDYLVRTIGANCYHLSAEALGSTSLDYRRRPSIDSLRGSELRELIDRRVPVLVYTVNDVHPGGLADHLAALGASAVFTDDPEGLCQLYGSR